MKNILVIEDNEDNLDLMVEILEGEGYRVLGAMNARKGIDLLMKQSVDLVFMDISLPGMSGLEATAIIKNDDQLKHIPIIALTAYAMMEDKKRAYEVGCDGYLTKPLDFMELLKTIEQYA